MSNNPFLDFQQQFFKSWTDNLAKLPGMEQYKGMIDSMAPAMENYWKNAAALMNGENNPWAAFMPKMPEGFQNPWAAFMPNANFQYPIPGMELYTKFLQFWQGMANPAAFAKEFPQKYMDLMQDVIGLVMPEGSAAFFQKPLELMNTCVNFFGQTMGPWMQIDEDILNRIASGDITAYMDFFKQANEKYEETFSKYFNMMGMGVNREANEDVMHAVNAYNRTLLATGSLMSLLMNTFSDSAKLLVEKFQSLAAEGKIPTTFREYYDLWSSVTEGELNKLLASDPFVRAFDDYADKYGQYMIAMNKVYERMLSGLPIPTNSDMKSLYKTVYDLRKEVRDLKRALTAAQSAKKEG